MKTVTVAPPLVPTPDRVDFGEITVWERTIAHITLRSRVDDPQEIHLTSRGWGWTEYFGGWGERDFEVLI